MSELPQHEIRRDGMSSVWQLFAAGELVAAYTTQAMGALGGVFTLRTGRGWTREMADRAFRAYFGVWDDGA